MRTILLRIFLVLGLGLLGRAVYAQPRPLAFPERFDAAMAAERFGEALSLLEGYRREHPENPLHGTAAQLLALLGRHADAVVEAQQCEHALDAGEAAVCAAVLRESRAALRAPPAPPAATLGAFAPPPVASSPVASPPVASPPVASPPVASPPVASPPVAPRPLRPLTPTARFTRTWRPRTGPLLLASLGGASLMAGGVLAALRDDALSGCTMRDEIARCPNEVAYTRAQRSPGLTTGANVALGLGVAALVAGAVWYFLDGRTVVPVVTADATLAVAGSW